MCHAYNASVTGLTTDLYELTMAAAYFENRISAAATFELFVRNLPPNLLGAQAKDDALDVLRSRSPSGPPG